MQLRRHTSNICNGVYIASERRIFLSYRANAASRSFAAADKYLVSLSLDIVRSNETFIAAVRKMFTGPSLNLCYICPRIPRVGLCCKACSRGQSFWARLYRTGLSASCSGELTSCTEDDRHKRISNRDISGPKVSSLPDPLWQPYANTPWQCLNFFPDPHGHASLRPILPHVAGSSGLRSSAATNC